MKKLFFLLIYSLILFTGLVFANNLPPLASFSDDVNRDFFFAGESVTFDGSGSIDQDEGGAYLNYYRWRVDGVIVYQGSSASQYTTSFSLSGGQSSKTVQVSLQVRDDEYTWSTTLTRTYTVRAGQDRHFYLKDHLGSVRVTVDEEGEPLGYDDYYPYGLQMPTRSGNTSNPNDRYKFTGHERDTEAGLTFDYMGARTYDPLLGIFMQIDPLMEFSTPYSYVGGNPPRLTDPTGMSSCEGRGAMSNFGGYEDYIAACADLSGAPIQQANKDPETVYMQLTGKLVIDPNITIDERLTTNKPHEDNPILEEQRKDFHKFWNTYGTRINKLFGEGRKFENTKITYYVGQKSNENYVLRNSNLTTFGQQGQDILTFNTGDEQYVDYGPEELEFYIYIQPGVLGQSGNSPEHEFKHILLILVDVAFPTGPVRSANWQHEEINSGRFDFDIYLKALIGD